MPPLRALFVLALGLSISTLCAQETDYASRNGRGLAIYQKNTFASADTAVLIEYSTFKVYPNVTYLRTPTGDRLTIDARRGGDLLMIPYPGKGEATPEEALAVLAVAQQRYPKFGLHFKALKKAWQKESKAPREIVEAEIVKREQNKMMGESFVEWVKGLFPKRAPQALPPSLLGPAPRTSNLPKQSEPETTPAPEAAETTPAKKNNVHEDLDLIKKYYETSKEIE